MQRPYQRTSLPRRAASYVLALVLGLVLALAVLLGDALMVELARAVGYR